jgi:hypothetical protein
MSTPESKVKEAVKKILQELNAYYCMTNTGGYGNSGPPDFLVCYQGRFYGIECKAGNNQPTALQLHHLSEIRRTGGKSIVINEETIAGLKALLQEY